MKVGVNYTPREGWFHSWLDLDVDAVRVDLEAIAGLGLDHIRVFPLWTLLQPDRGLVRERALDDVVALLDAAHEAGLDVWVDALNGHLSSFDFLPAWVTTWHRRNLFADPEVRSGQVHLVTALATRLRGHPAARGLGLGNEFAQFAGARHPDVLPVTPGDVDSWLAELLAAAAAAWPEGAHTHSYDDELWFTDTHPFQPRHGVEVGASTTVHSWVFGKDWGELSGNLDAYASFGRYLLELAAAWSPDPARPLWLQEIGAAITHVPTESAPAFLRASLEACRDMPGLEAVTWWCSHDVSRSMLDFPELEHTLGLLDSDGAVKPIGRELAAMVPELREASPLRGERPSVAMGVAADGSDRSRTRPGGPVFAQWWELARTGATPALTRA